MRKTISVLCLALLLCGAAFAQSAAPPQDSFAHRWANGKPLNVGEVDGFITGRIVFSGNATTRDNVVRRALGLREGEVFKRKQLARGLRRLNQLGLFERVTEGDVVFRAGGERNQVDLLVVVKERRQR